MGKWKWNGFRVGALGVWAFGAVTPGVVTALRASGAPSGSTATTSALMTSYGQTMTRYLGYCPDALLAFLLPMLTLAPVVVLLLALGEPIPGGSALRRSGLQALRVAATWAALSVLGAAFVFIASWARGAEPSALFGWASRLGLLLAISGLPAVGLAMPFALGIASRWRALSAALAVAGLVGIVGVLARILGTPSWVPGALDQALFSGRSDDLGPTVVIAALWFGAGVLLGALALGRRSRAARGALVHAVPTPT